MSLFHPQCPLRVLLWLLIKICKKRRNICISCKVSKFECLVEWISFGKKLLLNLFISKRKKSFWHCLITKWCKTSSYSIGLRFRYLIPRNIYLIPYNVFEFHFSVTCYYIAMFDLVFWMVTGYFEICQHVSLFLWCLAMYDCMDDPLCLFFNGLLLFHYFP